MIAPIETKVRPGRAPEASSRPTGPGSAMAQFLIDHLPADKTYNEIATDLGYARPNIVSMWKAGKTKFTLDNVMALADLTKVDPGYVLALYVDQYVKQNSEVDRFDEIVEIFTRLTTSEEWEAIAIIREARRGNSMPLTAEQRDGLKALFATPITTPEGPYKALTTAEDLLNGEGGDRRKFARRGYTRSMTVDEVEEVEARREMGKAEDSEGRPVLKAPGTLSKANAER